MKKTFKMLTALVLCIATVISIAGCSEVKTSTSTADVIVTTTSNTTTEEVTTTETTTYEVITTPEVTTTVEEITTIEATTSEIITTPEVTTTVEEVTTTEVTTKQTEITTTEKVTTTTTIAPAPLWNETEIASTKMYVTQNCNSRETAIQGSTVVKSYGFADVVTIIAKTDTGYYKLENGSFIHQDFLSKDKPIKQTTTTTEAIVTNPAEKIISDPDDLIWDEIIWDEPKYMYVTYGSCGLYQYPYVGWDPEGYHTAWFVTALYFTNVCKIVGVTSNNFYIAEKGKKHYYCFPESFSEELPSDRSGNHFITVRIL